MKLKKWIKYVDELDFVRIWGKENYPLFEGAVFEIPKKFLKYKIGRCDNDDDGDDKPIFSYIDTNEHGVKLAYTTINIKNDK